MIDVGNLVRRALGREIGVHGQRVPDNQWFYGTRRPGEYGRNYSRSRNDWRWYAMTPDGMVGCLDDHRVVVHRNDTITVNPAIKVGPAGPEWWLINGAWRTP